MSPVFFRMTALLPPMVALAGCGLGTGPVRPGDWFGARDQIVVEELANSSQCNAPDEQMRVTALAGGAAVKEWERARGIDITGGAEVPRGQYAVVDLGKPRAAGHGLAVSRIGDLRGDTLILKVTLFTPQREVALVPALTSPCALVRLPEVPFDKIRVVDQTGNVRTTSVGLALH